MKKLNMGHLEEKEGCIKFRDLKDLHNTEYFMDRS